MRHLGTEIVNTFLLLLAAGLVAFAVWAYRDMRASADWSDLNEQNDIAGDPRYDAWNAIFRASREGMFLGAACPYCGAQALRHYYFRRMGFGGAEWQWCGACGRYATWWQPRDWAPAWWRTDFPVSPWSVLGTGPRRLEDALRRAGRLPGDGRPDPQEWPPPPAPPTT